MDNKKLETLFAKAKEISIVDYLNRLGFHGKPSGRNMFYNSPLRDERTPSFAVNINKNVWYDWGTGEGGNIIDFGIRYFKCSPVEFLNKLQSVYSLDTTQPCQSKTERNEEPGIKILDVKMLHSYPLLKYLQERRIPRVIADEYCKEVNYELHGKSYYSIGFKNDAGGYSLRNAYVKAACQPNDVSWIDNNAKSLAVFEGFFDFLSYKALYHNQPEPKRNYLILNSTSFFEKSLPKMQGYNNIHLFLDNDPTGDKCTVKAIQIDSKRFIDERGLYKNYNDLNDFLKCFGQAQKPRLNQRL